jgi:plastocyanin
MKATTRRRLSAMALIVALGSTVTACGDDDASTAASEESTPTATATETATPAAASGDEIKLTATEDGGLGWDPKELSAPAGSVTIAMDNPEGNKMPHAVSIEGNGVDESGNVVEGGAGTSTVTADLEAGEYTFYCPVGQHRQNGMEGTLTVE